MLVLNDKGLTIVGWACCACNGLRECKLELVAAGNLLYWVLAALRPYKIIKLNP